MYHFDLKITCLCQSIKINNNMDIARARHVPLPHKNVDVFPLSCFILRVAIYVGVNDWDKQDRFPFNILKALHSESFRFLRKDNI